MLDPEIDYETYLAQEKYLLAGDANTTDVDDFVHHQAQHAHSLAIMDHLRDAMLAVVQSSYQLTTENAVTYMRFGAGRRFKMIWHAYRTIIFTAPPDREEPLPDDDTKDLTRDLNTIYGNLRGVLDNLAWVILYEKEPETAENIHPGDVDLLSKKMRKVSAFKPIAGVLSDHTPWGKEVKERRDPVAHRIPLTAPPSFLTEEEAKEYNKTYDEFVAAANKSDFKTSDQKFSDLDQLGTYRPVFVHHPNDGLIAMYPTIPTDMAHLIQLTNTVVKYLLPPKS